MKPKPIISEKSYRLAAGDKKTSRQFSFLINRKINKLEGKTIIEKIYKVNVLKVNILNTRGKVVNFKKTIGRRNDRHKLIVTLKPGQMIKDFELEEKKEEESKDK